MNNWTNWIFLSVILLIIGFLVFRYEGKIKNENNKTKQNIIALTDSIHKLNNTLYNKTIIEVNNKKELTLLNKQLNDTIKILEKELKGKINTIIDTKIEYIKEPVYISTPDIIFHLPDSSITQKWNWKDNWSLIEGENYIQLQNGKLKGHVKINKNQTDLILKTGIYKDKDGIKRIFIKTDNPNINITKLDGAIINNTKDKKNNRWGLGIYGGYGANWNPNDQKVQLGVQVGVGVIWRIY